MIRLMCNLPIFRRMIMAFIFATLLPSFIIALLGIFYIHSLTLQGQAVRTSFDAQSLASDESANLQRMNALLLAKFYQIFASESRAITDPSLEASGGLVAGEIRALEADFDRNLAYYRTKYGLSTSANMTDVVDILRSSGVQNAQAMIDLQAQALGSVSGSKGWWTVYKGYQNQLVNRLSALQMAMQNGNYLSHTDLPNEYQVDYGLLHQSILTFTNLRNSWQQVQQAAVTMGKAVTTIGVTQVMPIFVATASALVLIILVIILIGYIVNRTITRPLGQLATITTRINEGKIEARAPVNGRDEIAAVANAFNGMLNNIVYLVRDAQEQRDSLQERVEKLVSEVCNVGEGDLQARAEVTSDALGALADSFNYMVEELSSLVIHVKTMAHEVEKSTLQTFQSMGQLVSHGDRQIQQIGRATQEVESIAEVNRQVAAHAQMLHVIADQALLTADAGRVSLQQTLQGMGRIQTYVQDTSAKVQALGDSSREIDNIVGVISTIAQQTNRLALDAAVQAAMAGEHGKGFGAVAIDIRRLAERAKEQTNIITRIVRGVSEEIDVAAISMRDTERETAIGVQLAGQTGEALESIFGVVVRQGEEIDVINQMASRQLQFSDSAVRIMQDVSEATRQSSTNMRGVAYNMEHLAHLAEQLLSSVEAFKLRENMSAPFAPILHRHVQASGHGLSGHLVPGSAEVSIEPGETDQAFASYNSYQSHRSYSPALPPHLTSNAMIASSSDATPPGASEENWHRDTSLTGRSDLAPAGGETEETTRQDLPGNTEQSHSTDESIGADQQNVHKMSKFKQTRLQRPEANLSERE